MNIFQNDEYNKYNEKREKLVRDFDGKNGFYKFLRFFISEVWAPLCYLTDNEEDSLEEYERMTTVTAGHLQILQTGIMLIVKKYFVDLNFLLEHIEKTNQNPEIDIKTFLNTNKNIYMYYLNPNNKSKVKHKKIIKTELMHFLKRMSYDTSRYKLIFSEISVSYKRIGAQAKINSDLTVLNTLSSDIHLFLGDTDFHIEKSEHVCTFQPRIVTDTELYIYCKQICAQYVNSQLAQLFHVVQAGENVNFGQILQQRFPKPLFLNLNTRFLNQLEFEFRTRDGTPVLFDNSSDTINLMLILRPSSKGAI